MVFLLPQVNLNHLPTVYSFSWEGRTFEYDLGGRADESSRRGSI